MGKVQLLFSIFLNEKAKRLSMIVFIVLMILTANISISLLTNAYDTKKAAELCEFSDTTYFSSALVMRYDSQSNKTKNSVLSELEKEGIESGQIRYICTYSEILDADTKYMDYDDSIIEHMKLPLSKGSWFSIDETNEVILPYELSRKYSLGDKIQIDGCELEIIAFLDRANIVLECMTTGNVEIDDLLCKDSYVILTNGIKKPNGQKYSFDSTAPGIIIFDNKRTTVERLSKIGSSQSMEEISDNYMIHTRERFFSQLQLELILLILTISGLGTMNFLSMYQRRKEYGIYFLCGLTKRKTIFLSLGMNFIVSIIALAIVFLLYGMIQSMRIYFNLTNICVTFVIIMIILILSSIPFYLITKRESIINLTRR